VVLSEPQWHPDAILDAELARNWYAERSPFAARGFLLALDAAVSAVANAPNRWPERSHGCRHYPFSSRYPFSLVYRVGAGIEFVAVAHHRRHPDYWSVR
jgi:plasmid stabilization system protein ParE